MVLLEDVGWSYMILGRRKSLWWFMVMEDSDRGITILGHCRVPLTSISSQASQMMHIHFLHNSPVSWKTECNMQLLWTRWTWLTGKYVTKGFFVFFRRWALLSSNIPFSNSIFTWQVILEDLWWSRNKQCTIGDNYEPTSEMRVSFDQTQEQGIAISLDLEIFLV